MNTQITQNTGEIVVYQPDAELTLEVKVVDETVWLTTSQMAALFDKEESNIRRHVINIFKVCELTRENNVHFLHVNNVKKPVPFYSLDMIISVGYRVKSPRGVQFRIWANKILKNYILRGYAVNRQLIALQERTDERFLHVENRLEEQSEKVDFLVRAHTEPTEQIFPAGCVFDAWNYVSGLVRSAEQRVILIDKYVDERVLSLLNKRQTNVSAEIYSRYDENFLVDLEKHNSQYPHIDFIQLPHRSHDRFLIIDDTVYLLGASVKDMGVGLCAITQMEMSAEEVLASHRMHRKD